MLLIVSPTPWSCVVGPPGVTLLQTYIITHYHPLKNNSDLLSLQDHLILLFLSQLFNSLFHPNCYTNKNIWVPHGIEKTHILIVPYFVKLFLFHLDLFVSYAVSGRFCQLFGKSSSPPLEINSVDKSSNKDFYE